MGTVRPIAQIDVMHMVSMRPSDQAYFSHRIVGNSDIDWVSDKRFRADSFVVCEGFGNNRGSYFRPPSDLSAKYERRPRLLLAYEDELLGGHQERKFLWGPSICRHHSVHQGNSILGQRFTACYG